jgi:hypothetical protein
MAELFAKVNPANFLVTAQDITKRRKDLEQMPVTITEGVIDADDYSENVFRGASPVWMMLPVEERKWKMTDKSKVACPVLADLEALRDAMLVARGLRAAALHGASDYMKTAMLDGATFTCAQMEYIFVSAMAAL